MITTERIQTFLFWLLVLQCCVISVSIAAASMLLSLILLILLVVAVRDRTWNAKITVLDAAIIAYIAIEFLTAGLSDHSSDAFQNSKRLLLIAIAYGVVLSFKTEKKMLLALRLIAGMISVLSLAEIALYFQQGNERLSVFQHYMTTGGLKMIVGLLVMPFILGSETQKKDKAYFAGTLLPIVLSLIFTNTRSAWLGFLVGMIVMGGLYYRKLFYALILLIAAFFLFAPQQQVDRAKSIVDLNHPNNVGRVMMWTTGIEMWKDKPVFGFGDIDLYESYSQYRTPGIGEPAGHLHNNFVHLLVTLGAAGFLAVIFLFSTILRTEYLIFKRHVNDAVARNTALGGVAVFSGFLINGLFEWNFGDHEIMVMIWFTIGLSLAADTFTAAEKS